MDEVDERRRVECDWVTWNRNSVLYDSRGVPVEFGELALLDHDILELMTKGDHYLVQPEQEAGEYTGLGQVCVVESKRQRGRPRKEPGPAPPEPDVKPKRKPRKATK